MEVKVQPADDKCKEKGQPIEADYTLSLGLELDMAWHALRLKFPPGLSASVSLLGLPAIKFKLPTDFTIGSLSDSLSTLVSVCVCGASNGMS